MQLTSNAFREGAAIPERYGKNFENTNPPLTIKDAPRNTVSFALFMDDPDIPAAAGVPVWDHWVVFNIPADTRKIGENWRPTGVRGKGTRGELNYYGPRPPDREHRYFFRIYALDTTIDCKEGATKQEVQNAMRDHILASAELMGRYVPHINP